MRGLKLYFLLMVLALVIAFIWDKVLVIKNSVHYVLSPSLGWLLNWNTTFGMLIFIFFISLVLALAQKFGTDQEGLREIKKEQKLLQEGMKKYKDHPEKILELNRKQLEMIPKTFDITLKPLIYTFIPIILFFRWFNDYFTLNPYRFFGFLSWVWFYIIFSIVFSMIFRKLFKLV